MPDPAGLWVAVTRPVRQAQAISKTLERAGARVIAFPLVEILPCDTGPGLQTLVDQLDQFDLAVFVSPNAVEHCLELIRVRRPWPPHLACASVGRGTAAALAAAGIHPVTTPADGADSEALLRLPEFSELSGQRVLILRGRGGRELLADTLRRRGAEVSYLECYQRRPGRPDPDLLRRHWRDTDPLVVMVTSSEALSNLLALFDRADHERLLNTALVVNHPRVARAAVDSGWHGPVEVAQDAGDDAMLAALQRLKLS